MDKTKTEMYVDCKKNRKKSSCINAILNFFYILCHVFLLANTKCIRFIFVFPVLYFVAVVYSSEIGKEENKRPEEKAKRYKKRQSARISAQLLVCITFDVIFSKSICSNSLKILTA